jgi:hypothetical protein
MTRLPRKLGGGADQNNCIAADPRREADARQFQNAPPNRLFTRTGE